MTKLLEQHNIALPEGASKADFGDKTKDHDERCHALKASCSKTNAFLIDSGASNPMVVSRESFSSLQSMMVRSFTWVMTLKFELKGRVIPS